MTRAIRPAIIAGVLVLAGCASAPPGPSPESVAWVDGVCGAVKPFVEAVAAGPATDGADAAAAIKSLSTFLDTGATKIDGSIAALGSIGPSPVPGGDEILARMREDYTAQRNALRDAKAGVDVIDVANPETLATGLPAALQALPPTLDPTKDLRSNTTLAEAVTAAPVCQALPTSG